MSRTRSRSRQRRHRYLQPGHGQPRHRLLPLPSVGRLCQLWPRFSRARNPELACADPDDPCPLPGELVADRPLDAVTTDTSQAGLPCSSGTGLETTAYWSEVRDEIFNTVAPPSTRGFFQNRERTPRQGLELSRELRPFQRLALFGDVTYTRATFQANATLSAAFLACLTRASCPLPVAARSTWET